MHALWASGRLALPFTLHGGGCSRLREGWGVHPGGQRQGRSLGLQTLASVAAPREYPTLPPVGAELELRCDSLAFGGEGVCRLSSGVVVFVERALPGELLLARVVQSKKSFAKAVKLRTLRPHADAVPPPCPHYGPCGGCSLQALHYPAQAAAKQAQVGELLARVAGVPNVPSLLRPIAAAAPGQRYGFRNRMEFSFSTDRWEPAAGAGGGPSSGRVRPGQAVLGLHRPGSADAVLHVDACHLQSPVANAILAGVQRLIRELPGLTPYDPGPDAREAALARGRQGPGRRKPPPPRRPPREERERMRAEAEAAAAAAEGQEGEAEEEEDQSTGLLQHLVIRRGTGVESGAEEYLVNIVTSRDARVELAPLAATLMDKIPSIVGVVNSVSAKGRPAGERAVAEEILIRGRPTLTEKLCGLWFELSAGSFFQTNTAQAEVLYRLVAEAADLRPGDRVLDLYCGTGTIGLTLAGSCAEVHGVEAAAPAVADARRNAARNGVPNFRVTEGDVGELAAAGALEWGPRGAGAGGRDVVVADPGRTGLAPGVVAFLREAGAAAVVYVSCNPATQARDLRALCAPGPGALALASVVPVDLYPQTSHVETVALLLPAGGNSP